MQDQEGKMGLFSGLTEKKNRKRFQRMSESDRKTMLSSTPAYMETVTGKELEDAKTFLDHLEKEFLTPEDIDTALKVADYSTRLMTTGFMMAMAPFAAAPMKALRGRIEALR